MRIEKRVYISLNLEFNFCVRIIFFITSEIVFCYQRYWFLLLFLLFLHFRKRFQERFGFTVTSVESILLMATVDIPVHVVHTVRFISKGKDIPLHKLLKSVRGCIANFFAVVDEDVVDAPLARVQTPIEVQLEPISPEAPALVVTPIHLL